jgi:hypothetical protein
MNTIEKPQYWFGFRQILPKPPGVAVPCGPFNSCSTAEKERERMKAWDAAVSIPFTAETRAEAIARAEELTGKL